LDDGVNRKTVKGFSGSRRPEKSRHSEQRRPVRLISHPMKRLRFGFVVCSTLLLAVGCTMKPTSPRAAVEVTTPELRSEERNLAESKRAYYERLKDRTAAIYHEKNLSNYSEAEAIAAQELGPPPTRTTREEISSTEDRRATEEARKRQKYNEDLKSAAEEVSSQRSP
jgi:hypothetical protein